MLEERWLRPLILLLILLIVRVLARWRVDRRQRVALTTPLVDGVLLETVFAPRPGEGDDADLLAEMRDTFAHLNRRAYAEEFWGVSAQLAALEKNLGPNQKATMRRALLRLLETDNRWLQHVAADTCAELGVTDAVPRLRALLETDTGSPVGTGKPEDPNAQSADLRYREELEDALSALTD